MKWKTINARMQEDTLGNQYQIDGGCTPKACQVCKKKFKSEIKKFEIKQDVPSYECRSCKFITPSADQALSHEHNDIDSKLVNTVVGHENKIIGSVAHIVKTSDDVKIYCEKCLPEV